MVVVVEIVPLRLSVLANNIVIDDRLPTQPQSDCHKDQAYKQLFGKKVEILYLYKALFTQ